MSTLTGIVKWFNKQRGYGYIESNGREYFCHQTKILTGGFRYLAEGEQVCFTPEENEKGIEAINVQVLNRQEKTRSFRSEIIQKEA